jgi:SAM-dependent methyltransferase
MTSADWDTRYASSELVWSAGPNVWVEEIAAGLTPGRALDLAGGEGRNALWLAERGWDVLCVDFSQVALDRATELAAQRPAGTSDKFAVLKADLQTYAAPTKSYDLVLVIYVHVPAAQRQFILANAAQAVAPGGRLLVVAHHSDNLSDGVGGPQNPDLLYTQDNIAYEVTASGLVVERAARVLRQVPADGQTKQAVDALYVGQRPA